MRMEIREDTKLPTWTTAIATDYTSDLPLWKGLPLLGAKLEQSTESPPAHLTRKVSGYVKHTVGGQQACAAEGAITVGIICTGNTPGYIFYLLLLSTSSTQKK